MQGRGAVLVDAWLSGGGPLRAMPFFGGGRRSGAEGKWVVGSLGRGAEKPESIQSGFARGVGVGDGLECAIAANGGSDGFPGCGAEGFGGF